MTIESIEQLVKYQPQVVVIQDKLPMSQIVMNNVGEFQRGPGVYMTVGKITDSRTIYSLDLGVDDPRSALEEEGSFLHYYYGPEGQISFTIGVYNDINRRLGLRQLITAALIQKRREFDGSLE